MELYNKKGTAKGVFTISPKPTEQFELDFNKIKSVKGCVLVLKLLLYDGNQGAHQHLYVSDIHFLYDDLKHLAKDGSLRRFK